MRGVLTLFGRRKPKASLFDKAERIAPGALVVGAITLAAEALSGLYGGPVILYALLFGIALHILNANPRLAPGVGFSAKQVLAIGVALLGARITFGDIVSLGWMTGFFVLALVAGGVVGGWRIGRMFGLRNDFSILSAVSVAICGVSAVVAVSAVLPDRKSANSQAIIVILIISIVSTLTMIVYPYFTQIMQFNSTESGVFLGAAIANVSQAVGAGYMIDDAAGRVATIVKLARVATLALVILAVAYAVRGSGAPGVGRKQFLPNFILAFLALAAVNSLGVARPVMEAFGVISGWCIIAAVAAVGVQTAPDDLMRVGRGPLLVLGAQTIFLALLAAIWILVARNL